MPKNVPNREDASRVVKRIFDVSEAGNGMVQITSTPNDEGILSPKGKLWGKTSVHAIPINEAHTGALVWGVNAKDNAEPVRVEKAFPAIITRAQLRRAAKPMRSRAPTEGAPPQGRKHLPPQRAGQVQGVQQSAQRSGCQERPVRLLRLPVDHEAGQGHLHIRQA